MVNGFLLLRIEILVQGQSINAALLEVAAEFTSSVKVPGRIAHQTSLRSKPIHAPP